MNQMSIFEFIDETEYMTPEEKVFDSVLNRGSNVEQSMQRIMEHIDQPVDEFAQFLKKEFGIGGSCWTGYNTWWDGKGLKAGVSFDSMKLYSWEEVAKAFKKKYKRC